MCSSILGRLHSPFSNWGVQLGALEFKGGFRGEAIAIVGGGPQNALFLYMGGAGAPGVEVGEIAADWKYVGGL